MVGFLISRAVPLAEPSCALQIMHVLMSRDFSSTCAMRGSFMRPKIIFVSCYGYSNLNTCLTSFFWKKNPVRLQKKEKKSHLWCLTDKSGFEIFCQTPKKKRKKVLRIFFVSVIQSTTGSYHCCSGASRLEGVYLPPFRLQGLID